MDAKWWSTPLSWAQCLVSEEIDILEAERDAFVDFRRRLQRQDSAIAPDLPEGGPMVAVQTDQQNPILSAYRETVMALPQYETEYGEPAVENMHREFGPDTAQLVANRSPLSRRAADRAAAAAIARRENLMDRLPEERDLLDRMERQISECHARLDEIAGPPADGTLDDLYAGFDRLDDCEAWYELLLAERQQRLRTYTRVFSDADSEELLAYLYQELPVTFPVLTTLATLYGCIEDTRAAYRRAIIEADA